MDEGTMQSKSSVPVPRSFILIDCLNRANKFSEVAYGLADELPNEEKMHNTISLEKWTGTIFCENGNNMDIYQVDINCNHKFPQEAPHMKFSEYYDASKVKKICDPNKKDGTLRTDMIEHINDKWNNTMGIGEALMLLLKAMKK